ncbi:hypothetical protein C4D60_Mb09t26400 [Musa balbisiana]|uniref:Uncharacterized protein n=1 Tax=Musa balbisiana TaxID=52838 RepID=A0A4S8IJC1_MUSBA|nr:hypothetical protein C4D60_Mb09t26400 [Musa balbisiana]
MHTQQLSSFSKLTGTGWSSTSFSKGSVAPLSRGADDPPGPNPTPVPSSGKRTTTTGQTQ